MSTSVRPDAGPWGAELAQRLASLADVLLPGGAGMPSATAADVPSGGLQRVFEARPDLAPALARVVGASLAQDPAGADATGFVQGLRAADPAGWTVLTTCVAAAYYMTPSVRRLLGYAGQEGVLITADDFFSWVSAGLLDPVIERGPIGRPAPA